MATINVAPSASHISHNLSIVEIVEFDENTRLFYLLWRLLVTINVAPSVSHISNYYFEVVEFS